MKERGIIMKRFMKEFLALVSGMAFSYGWQLFGILMIFLEPNRTMDITPEMFIPIPGIMLTITPIITWGVMGLLKVSWFDRWLVITAYIFTFVMPFVLISGIAIVFLPNLWLKPAFWGGTVILTIVIFLTVLKPTLKILPPHTSEPLPDEK